MNENYFFMFGFTIENIKKVKYNQKISKFFSSYIIEINK